MTNNSKKVRSEYMRKFLEPKWETFAKCYQDSLEYRMSRRLMEQTHRPLFLDGWDSDSSGVSRGDSTDGPRRLNGGGPTEPGSLRIENGYERAPENGPWAPGVRERRRAPRPEQDRARSQDSERLPRAARNLEVWDQRRTNMKGSASAGEIHRADVGVQTRRESDKRAKALDRRRARSADLEKLRRAELTPVKDCWITEYMRCFSARLR